MLFTVKTMNFDFIIALCSVRKGLECVCAHIHVHAHTCEVVYVCEILGNTHENSACLKKPQISKVLMNYWFYILK